MEKKEKSYGSVSSILRDVRGRNPVSWTKTLRKKTEKSKGDLMKQKRVEQSFKAKAFDELFDDLFGDNSSKKTGLDTAATRLERMRRKRTAKLHRLETKHTMAPMTENPRFAASTASSKANNSDNKMLNARLAKRPSTVHLPKLANKKRPSTVVCLPKLANKTRNTRASTAGFAKKSAAKAANIFRYMMNTEARCIRNEQIKNPFAFSSMPWLQGPPGEYCPGHFCGGAAFCLEAKGLHAVLGRQIILFQMGNEGRAQMREEESARQKDLVYVCLQCATAYAADHQKRLKSAAALSSSTPQRPHRFRGKHALTQRAKREQRTQSPRSAPRRPLRVSTANRPEAASVGAAYPQSPRVAAAARAAAKRKTKAKSRRKHRRDAAALAEQQQPKATEAVLPAFDDARMAQLRPRSTRGPLRNRDSTRDPLRDDATGSAEEPTCSWPCTICDCLEFTPNPFLSNRCNHCAHGLDCHPNPNLAAEQQQKL